MMQNLHYDLFENIIFQSHKFKSPHYRLRAALNRMFRIIIFIRPYIRRVDDHGRFTLKGMGRLKNLAQKIKN
ncbi:hypothetical protein RIR_jg11547.t1 [Rhizophagus irregularis DAOM 181602=DAOM 197198]|uniref:Uncharacterized protein n=1 Tax=Rhizophagus irregularis (strain DAOM 181602 / DAOM 197198 / MUCL 43194) TaxID=747089 RepID=U9UTX4_RHIID|nr:hypothetical protein RIR_jg11547.t1 [Rhizophagus irregularis DAOM 181602=DAOM 197198]